MFCHPFGSTEFFLPTLRGPGRRTRGRLVQEKRERDNEFMVGRILAMARAYALPRGRNPPATIPSSGLVVPLQFPCVPTASRTTGPILADSTGEKEASPRKSPTSHSSGEEQDNFSVEFTRL